MLAQYNSEALTFDEPPCGLTPPCYMSRMCTPYSVLILLLCNYVQYSVLRTVPRFSSHELTVSASHGQTLECRIPRTTTSFSITLRSLILLSFSHPAPNGLFNCRRPWRYSLCHQHCGRLGQKSNIRHSCIIKDDSYSFHSRFVSCLT
jgi:hypothetical protein